MHMKEHTYKDTEQEQEQEQENMCLRESKIIQSSDFRRAQTCTYIRTYMKMHRYAHINACTNTHTLIQTYLHTHTHTHIHNSSYLSMYDIISQLTRSSLILHHNNGPPSHQSTQNQHAIHRILCRCALFFPFSFFLIFFISYF